MYWPPRPTPSPSTTPTPRPTPPPPTTPAPAPPATPTWRPPHDPWTGMVQARSMPWASPSPIGAPPAYSSNWTPDMRPHTGAPRLLGPCPPLNAYHAASVYYPYVTDGGSQYMHYTPPSLLVAPPPTAPPPPSTSTSAPSPSWDQSAFLQAMNNFAAQGNSVIA
jgi:hypothetical protein